jgi:hypothetical protein
LEAKRNTDLWLPAFEQRDGIRIVCKNKILDRMCFPAVASKPRSVREDPGLSEMSLADFLPLLPFEYRLRFFGQIHSHAHAAERKIHTEANSYLPIRTAPN